MPQSIVLTHDVGSFMFVAARIGVYDPSEQVGRGEGREGEEGRGGEGAEEVKRRTAAIVCIVPAMCSRF